MRGTIERSALKKRRLSANHQKEKIRSGDLWFSDILELGQYFNSFSCTFSGTSHIEICGKSLPHTFTQVACRDREHPMTMRTSRKTVTFRRPFLLSGMDVAQPAGSYTVETNEELLEGLSFPAWRRTATVILLRPQAGAAGPGEDLDIDPSELEAAQESDAVIQPDVVVDATIDELLADAVLQQAVHSAGLTLAEFRTLLRDLAARILAVRLRRASASRTTPCS